MEKKEAKNGKRNLSEDDAEINPIEIKIENDKIENIFEKYKKTQIQIQTQRRLKNAKRHR